MLIPGMPIRQPDERVRKILMYDAVIHVYDAAGNEIEDARVRWRFERALSEPNKKPPRW